MPIYAYQCRECENEFEVRQRFSDDPLDTCTICHTEGSVFRVIQPAGVVFKGSGFYVTDTRSKNAARPTSSNGNGNGSENTTANGSTENKSSENGATSNSKKSSETSASDAPSAQKKAS
jgi:putative FmdB family regulatory protein